MAERRPFDGLGFTYMAMGVGALLYGLDRIASAKGADLAGPAALAATGLVCWPWLIGTRSARRIP